MHAKALAGDHFFARHGAFCAHLKPDGQALGIYRLHNTADDLANLFFIERKLRLALGVTDALLDDLARGLRGDAAKILWCCFHYHHLAWFCLRIVTARFVHRHLGARILYLIDDLFVRVDRHLTGIEVDLGFHLLCIGCIDGSPVG